MAYLSDKMSSFKNDKMLPLEHEYYNPQIFQNDFKERLQFNDKNFPSNCSYCDAECGHYSDDKSIQTIIKNKIEGFNLDTSFHTMFLLVFIILIALFIYSNRNKIVN